MLTLNIDPLKKHAAPLLPQGAARFRGPGLDHNLASLQSLRTAMSGPLS
jgi:hypothetical protein